MCVPMPTHCTITCFGFRARRIDGVECGLFSIHAPLGQTHYLWDDYLYSVLEQVKVRQGADQSSKAAFGKSAFAKTYFLLLKIRHGAHQSSKKQKCFRARFSRKHFARCTWPDHCFVWKHFVMRMRLRLTAAIYYIIIYDCVWL